jgi:hypothetical protein
MRVHTWKDGLVLDEAPPPGGGVNIVTNTSVLTIPGLPTLPAAGGTFVDPTFGTTIRRLTDASSLAGSSFYTGYSYWDTPNSNGSRLRLVTIAGGAFAQFDSTTGAISNLVEAPGGILSYEHSFIWSRTNADKGFGFQGATVRTLTFSGATPGAWTTLVDLAANAQLSAVFGSSGWYAMHISLSGDDDVICGLVKSNAGVVQGYFAYKFSTSTGYPFADLYAGGVGVNEVQIDKSGRYISVSRDHAPGASVIEMNIKDLTGSNDNDLTDGSPDYAPSHQDCGTAFEVGEDNWRSKLTARSLDTPHTQWTLGGDYTMQQAAHPSLRHDDQNWCLMGSYSNNAGTSCNGELWFVKTDGSAGFRRFAHHRNVFPNGGGICPWQSATRDAKWVFWCSNWGNAAGRVDVFCVRVPDGTLT